MDAEGARLIFDYLIRTEYDNPRLLQTETVNIKNGPRAFKSASILTFGDKASGEVRKRALRLQTWKARVTGGYDFDTAEYSWTCENEEIVAVRALLNGDLVESGSYEITQSESGISALLKRLESNSVDSDALHKIVAALSANPTLTDAVAELEDAELLAGVIDRARQSRGLQRLQEAVNDPTTTEPLLQRILENEWWVFGGRYIAPASRRSLTVLDQLDIPLITANGALHVVELKQANIPKLVVPYRNHMIVGAEIQSATGQAMNYLRALDEQRATIWTELGIDCRRAFATVVLGHPKYVSEFDKSAINETIRIFNSHLSRIEVITYDDLIGGAQQALNVAAEQAQQ